MMLLRALFLVGVFAVAAAAGPTRTIEFKSGKKKTVVLVFMQQAALDGFRGTSGWKAGVDGSVAMIDLGAGGSVDTTNIKDPIVGFVFGQKGLMANLTLEGSKFTKLNKSE